MLIVIGAHGTIPKELIKGLGRLGNKKTREIKDSYFFVV